MKHNLSGELMEPGTSRNARLAMRRLRRLCAKRGALLGKFKQVYGWETQLGPEWVASARHWGDAVVVVHQSFGDRLLALRFCHNYYEIGGCLFVVNFLGPSDFVQAMKG